MSHRVSAAVSYLALGAGFGTMVMMLMLSAGPLAINEMLWSDINSFRSTFLLMSVYTVFPLGLSIVLLFARNFGGRASFTLLFVAVVLVVIHVPMIAISAWEGAGIGVMANTVKLIVFALPLWPLFMFYKEQMYKRSPQQTSEQ